MAFYWSRFLLLPELPLHPAVPGSEAQRAQQLRGLGRQPEQHLVGGLPGTVQAQEPQGLAPLLSQNYGTSYRTDMFKLWKCSMCDFSAKKRAT